MADIEIRMLGKFEILMDGKPVLAALKQSRKATMLIQYLVLQKGERVPCGTANGPPTRIWLCAPSCTASAT